VSVLKGFERCIERFGKSPNYASCEEAEATALNATVASQEMMVRGPLIWISRMAFVAFEDFEEILQKYPKRIRKESMSAM
jgi:hypothetical protein